jgi:transposase-like protein
MPAEATGIEHEKPYLPELRREAVELYERSGRSPREIASDLGVSPESLRLWVGTPGSTRASAGLTTEEREELRLRREMRVLREEGEVGP